MRRIEGNLSKYDDRMKESIEAIQKDLNKRFNQQESNISVSIKNLEKYLEDVHSQ